MPKDGAASGVGLFRDVAVFVVGVLGFVAASPGDLSPACCPHRRCRLSLRSRCGPSPWLRSRWDRMQRSSASSPLWEMEVFRSTAFATILYPVAIGIGYFGLVPVKIVVVVGRFIEWVGYLGNSRVTPNLI